MDTWRTRPLGICLLLLAGANCLARQAILECTADTWVATPARKSEPNHGRDREIKTGAAALAFLDFRMSVVEGWQVTGARLLLHVNGALPPPVLHLALARAAWTEDKAGPEAAPGRGWIVLKPVGMKSGWYSFDLPAPFAGALVSAEGKGLALSSARNAVFDSHETVQYAPYLVIEGK